MSSSLTSSTERHTLRDFLAVDFDCRAEREVMLFPDKRCLCPSPVGSAFFRVGSGLLGSELRTPFFA